MDKTELGVRNDYATIYSTAEKPWGIDSSKVDFYYGHESTEYDPENGDWCFTAKLGDKLLVSYTTTELRNSCNNHLTKVSEFLVQGMYLFINELTDYYERN